MRHKHYTRVTIPTGVVEVLPFVEEDGQRFGRASTDGYHNEVALSILNRWNYMSANYVGTPRYLYYLHTAEGANR